MSTRANIVIVTEQGKFKFQANSSAYPSNFAKPIFEFIRSLATKNLGCRNLENGIGFYEPDSITLPELISDLGLSLGTVGNFCYVYEIDFVKKTLRVWEEKISWINAPEDWKERGWNCWIGKNGKYGYSNWIKGKKIFDSKFIDMLKKTTFEDTTEFRIDFELLEKFEKI